MLLGGFFRLLGLPLQTCTMLLCLLSIDLVWRTTTTKRSRLDVALIKSVIAHVQIVASTVYSRQVQCKLLL